MTPEEFSSKLFADVISQASIEITPEALANLLLSLKTQQSINLGLMKALMKATVGELKVADISELEGHLGELQGYERKLLEALTSQGGKND